MPREWTTWSDGRHGLEGDRPRQSQGRLVVSQRCLAAARSGYAAGVDGLRGNADIVTFDVGEGHVMISATDLNFRTWPRVAWTVVANAIYHGPSTEVPAPPDPTTERGDDRQRHRRSVGVRQASGLTTGGCEARRSSPCRCGMVGGDDRGPGAGCGVGDRGAQAGAAWAVVRHGPRRARGVGVVQGQRLASLPGAGRSLRAGVQVLVPEPEIPMQARAGAVAAAGLCAGRGAGGRGAGLGGRVACLARLGFCAGRVAAGARRGAARS